MEYRDLFDPQKVYLSMADRKRAKRGELPLRFQRAGSPKYMSQAQADALKYAELSYPILDDEGRILRWKMLLNLDEINQKREQQERREKLNARLPQFVRENPGRPDRQPDRGSK